MQYEELIEDIFRRHPSVQVSGFNGGSYKAGIDSMREFDRTLGSPWKSFRCIHIAGTNGKGSVSSMIASCLAAAGYRVGLYTSPHILDFRERIKIVGSEGFEMIDRDSVMDFLTTYNKDIENLSFFEITTGMGLWWMRKMKVDYAVIEVGLGGRLDSTNIITPELSIITSIGLDHCAMLGGSRQEIAFEKSGIFKGGRKALVWGHDPETDEVFTSTAEKIGAELYFANEIEEEYELPEDMDLPGEYQKDNVRTVRAAMKLLEISIDNEAITNAAKRTGLHARWEKISSHPDVICDIGHNPPALEKNFLQLKNSGKRLHIVYGIMADKALEDIVPMMPADARYYLCAPDSQRSLPSKELQESIRNMRPEMNTRSFPSVAQAVKAAMESADKDELIYIGGSTFVVAEAMGLF